MNCIILARGGSKGLPNKNIKLLNGEPLLSYPIKAALKTKYIDNIYVSTDSEQIADVAFKYGAIVIERPDHLSTDKSLDIEALRHAVSYLKSHEDLVQLRATTPII